MKNLLKVLAIIVTTIIVALILIFGIKYGIPYLEAKSKHAQELPTIEQQQNEIDSLNVVIDSLSGIIIQLEAASNLKGLLVTDASKRNAELQAKYDKLADIFSRIPESELDAFINQFNQ